ncbi:uncharacterized protein B0T15DRAFT_496001 [Chaetomium strumarium]|uniref:Uncharacterized protein n=1 Tax=Chaetomium strumarium TaxID=1170767 RepID=A0AAJ0GPE1_9PEZI|nr:hypothetical protein B0T15DRAFT_496001 [Chaetomium strumarium]
MPDQQTPTIPATVTVTATSQPVITTTQQQSQHHIEESSNSGTAASSRPTGAGVNTGAGTTREKTEAELEADRRYEEAMEDEYAKREGGAGNELQQHMVGD